jgi:putative ABC transport system permease protein
MAMDNLIRDLRYALRSTTQRPGFTLAVVLTLAIGIGSSTAIFSLVDAALLRPLPFKDPETLVFVAGVAGPEKDRRGGSFPEVLDWQKMSQTVEPLSVFDNPSMTWRTDASAERVEAEMVSGNYFTLLGGSAALGRTFDVAEDRVPDVHPVAVVSDKFWRGRLDANPQAIGKPINLNERHFTVIGVMPPTFRGIDFDTEVWVPSMMLSTLASPRAFEDRGSRWLGAVGRLRDGVRLEQAQADMNRVAAQLTAAYPDHNTDRGIELIPLREFFLGNTRTLLLVVLAAVGVFLLLACANVTGLQLVRATTRVREIAVRQALGANRRRLIQQLLIEGVVLALLGAATGVLLAKLGISLLTPLIPEGVLPSYVQVTMNMRVLALSMAIALLCGIIFGLIPALRSVGLELATTLRQGGRTSTGGIIRLRRPGPQQVLVIAEVALALVLLIGAGLLLRSFQRLLSVDPGFRAEGVLTARFSFPVVESTTGATPSEDKYSAENRAEFAMKLAQRLEQIPAITAVAVGSDMPLSNNWNAARLNLEGGPEDGVRYYRHQVSPQYFRALGIPLIRGREFTNDDRRETPQVAIISDAMAKRFWPDQDPIGKSFRVGPGDAPEIQIVGVVGNARFRDLTTNLSGPVEPDVYYPLLQRTARDLEIAIRTTGNPAASTEFLRRELAAIDPAIPIYRVRTMEELLRRMTAASRFASLIVTSFGIVALLLAAVGIYGIMAFVVSRSTREIAVRMALGAPAREVVGLIVRQGFMLVLIGLGFGLIGAILTTRLLSAQLFEIHATDPITFTAISATLAIVALVASWLPARRAAGVDPQLVLRVE